ncbi:NADP(+)-dependent 2-alkenal reductase-like protein [Tanacetum coccineum]
MGGGAGVAAATMVESKEWYLAAYAPENVPTSEHIKLRTVNVSLEYDSIPDQHVLVQLLMISVDPYLRNVITGRDGDLYLPQIHQQDIQHLHVNVTSVLTEFGIARVVRSKNSNFNEGDIVVNGFSLIAEYSVIPSDFLRKIDPTANINLSDYINCLGKMSIKRTHPGFTALYRDRGDWEPASGFDCVYILRQAGGVERLQGSLPKAYGVSSFWESNGSVQILKDEFGYDEAFNYRKESDFDAALAKYFPNGIDFYLDNVGGKMLEAVLNHVNKGARIAISGVDVSVKTNQRTGEHFGDDWLPRHRGLQRLAQKLSFWQAQVDKPRINKCKKESFCVTDQELEHFGDDTLPRPPGLQLLAKSQRSGSNSTASSGSNPIMYQEFMKEQYKLDRKAKMQVIEQVSEERRQLIQSQRIAEDMKALQIDTRRMDPADAVIIC